MSFADQFAMFPVWNLVLWIVWAGMFVVLETLGVRSNHYATLTYLIRSTIPQWALAPFAGWMVWHFLIQYLIHPEIG